MGELFLLIGACLIILGLVLLRRESRNRRATLNLAIWFAFFLVLAVAAQSHAEDYNVYRTPNGALVISNQKPPPWSQIIKQLNLPESHQAQEPDSQPNVQPEGSPKPSKNK
jgi:hypothetical protein